LRLTVVRQATTTTTTTTKIQTLIHVHCWLRLFAVHKQWNGSTIWSKLHNTWFYENISSGSRI